MEKIDENQCKTNFFRNEVLLDVKSIEKLKRGHHVQHLDHVDHVDYVDNRKGFFYFYAGCYACLTIKI